MDVPKNFRGRPQISDDIEKFHDLTRDITVIFTFLLPLGFIAYLLIYKYRRRQDVELEFSRVAHIVDDDAFASRFVIVASTLALTVSQGAILLLPFSVLANEIIHSYPDNYYFQWLTTSVITDLWNLISLFSNVSLITLIFAYFLSESEGFDGSRKGLSGRVKEALVTVIFVLIFAFGLALLVYNFLNHDTWEFLSLLKWNKVKLFLPWFYTCLSFIGAVILLSELLPFFVTNTNNILPGEFLAVSVPYGYARLFSVVGRLVKRPLLAADTTEEYLKTLSISPDADKSASITNVPDDLNILEEELEEHLNPSFFRRTLLYPLLMLLMLLWTSFCILVCFINLIQMTLGLRDLPGVSTLADVGITSLSSLGMVGACLEVLIIGYTVVAFLVGCYSLPWIGRIKPRLHETSLPQIVANCALILLLSSALPLFCRVLGITNFDLLGNFVHISWLRNLRVIVGYNILYLVASVLVLTAHATNAVWQSICERLKVGTNGIKKVAQRSSNSAFKERLFEPLVHISTKNGYLKKHS